MKKSLLLPIALFAISITSCQVGSRTPSMSIDNSAKDVIITNKEDITPEISDVSLPVPVIVDEDKPIKEDVKYEAPVANDNVPVLTQAALDVLKNPVISFSGIDEIALYTIVNTRYTSTTILSTATYMDGTNWAADYLDTNTSSIQRIYYSNYEGEACQAGVSFMNRAIYEPMLDDNGVEVSWADAGLYNSLDNLKVSDFTYNSKTKYFDYNGSDSAYLAKIAAMATPYEMVVDNFAIYVHEGAVIELIITSEFDYTIAANYKAIQTMKLCINTGDSVEVPTIPSFSHETIHDDLGIAINNMRSLDSYTLSYHALLGSPYATGYTESGFVETITQDDLYFAPVSRFASDGSGDVISLSNDVYGYHKFSDDLYNSYYAASDASGNTIPNTYEASRAFNGSIKDAAPSFAFAPEIFRSYATSEDGSITYFVDDSMVGVASTFYNGVGNDTATYGIFATRGYTSQTSSFTPYVTIKDGYIVYSCFYFNLGTMYGIIECDYSGFNSSKLPGGTEINFPRREIPSSWSELVVQYTDASDVVSEIPTDVMINDLIGDETASSRVPFFGTVLGDAYGFGMNQYYRPTGSSSYVNSLCMYYDVPLDPDYTINDTLRTVYLFLIESGYTNIGNNVYVKNDITIVPVDNSLDFLIYVYKTVA